MMPASISFSTDVVEWLAQLLQVNPGNAQKFSRNADKEKHATSRMVNKLQSLESMGTGALPPPRSWIHTTIKLKRATLHCASA